LGGGSSDAASALSLLNTFFSLNLSPSQLLGLALELGSDCPFFIINKPCYATGRGEILNEISVDLSEYKILIINPGLEISTASAFSWLTRTAHRINLREAIREPVSEWKHYIHNDFEPVVFERFPQLLKIR